MTVSGSKICIQEKYVKSCSEIKTACCRHFNSSFQIFRENQWIQISTVDNDTVEKNSEKKLMNSRKSLELHV